MDAQEQTWQAESDARTLAAAAAINSDPERLERARSAAKDMVADSEKMAKQQVEEVRALKLLAADGAFGDDFYRQT